MNEVIKSFLVGLGFQVDESSLQKFNKSLASATLKVTALYTAINAAGAAIFTGIAKISEGFEQMGYEMRLIAPTINKVLVLRQELLKAYSRAGVDIYQVVQQSVKFNMSLTKTQYALKALATGVAARFFPLLTKQMDIFRNNIYKNMPRIQMMLEKFINFVFKAFEATVILGQRIWSILSRVYDFFDRLHKATDGWSTVILGVIAAWRLLNLSFLATPLGMILTGLLAILALYDDFMTFKEGGKSLFDWGPVIPFIDGVADAIQFLIDAWRALVDIVLNFGLAIYQVFKGDNVGALESLKAVGNSLIGVFSKLWDVLKLVGQGIDHVGAAAADAIKSIPFGEIFSSAAQGIGNLFGAVSAGISVGRDNGQQIYPNNQPGPQGQPGIPGQNGAPGRDGILGRDGAPGQDGISPVVQNLQKNMQAPLGSSSVAAAPLGVSNVANSQSNQHVNQQTSINVMGSADANSVGKAVASEQSRVNFDMVRNLKGATR